MAVRADHDIAGENQPLFRKEGVLDPCLPDLKEMGQAILLRKLPQYFTLLRRQDVLGGRKMVGNENNLVPVEDLLCPDLLESLNGKGRGNVVSKGEVDPDVNEVSGMTPFSCMGRQIFSVIVMACRFHNPLLKVA